MQYSHFINSINIKYFFRLRWWVCCVTDLWLVCVHAQSLSSVWLFVTPMEPMTVRLLCPWDSSDKNAGVGFHALLQGILPNLGIEPKSPASPEWQADSLLLSHLGRPTCCMPTLILVALLIFSIQMKYALSLIYFFPNSFDNRNPWELDLIS